MDLCHRGCKYLFMCQFFFFAPPGGCVMVVRVRNMKESKGHRKVLASADINLKRFASPTPTQTDLTLKLKPLSVKVVEATLKLSLSCVFVREGKAT